MRGAIKALALLLVLSCLSGCAGNDITTEEPKAEPMGEEEKFEDSTEPETYKECLFTENDEIVKDKLIQYENKMFSSEDVFYISIPVTEDTSLWDKFVDETAAGKESEIIIGQSTIEGDIIYSYLYFTGDHYYIGIDNSRDKYRGTDEFYSCKGFFLQLDCTDVPDNEIVGASGEYERLIAYLTQLDYAAIKMEPGQVYNMPIEYGVCSFIRRKASS